MNVFLRELRQSLRGFAIWAAVLVFFVAVGTYKFTGMQGATGDQARQLLDQFPRVILAAFGMAETNVMEFGGFFAMIEFYAVIIIAIYALGLGRGAVTREITDGTAEFLFTRPVARGRVLAEKLAAALVLVAAMAACNAVAGAGAYAALDTNVSDFPAILAAGTAWVALEGLFFLGLGAALGAACPRGEIAGRLGASLLALFYIASIAFDMFGDEADWLRWFSPIRYVGMNDVAAGTVTFTGATVLVKLSIILLVYAFASFERRDL